MASWLWGSHGYWDGSPVLFSLPRIFHEITIMIVKDTMGDNAPTSKLVATTSVTTICTLIFGSCSRARVRVRGTTFVIAISLLRSELVGPITYIRLHYLHGDSSL